MKKKLYFFAGMLAVLVVFAAKSSWKLKPQDSMVAFTIKNLGMDVNGTFTGFSADILFDEKDPASARIKATIDAATINTENAKRDQHLKADDYFDVKKFPKITFESKSVKKQGEVYLATGDLFMKGAVKTVDIPFNFKKQSGKGIFEGTFRISRLDFNVGESSMSTSDSVKILIRAVATR